MKTTAIRDKNGRMVITIEPEIADEEFISPTGKINCWIDRYDASSRASLLITLIDTGSREKALNLLMDTDYWPQYTKEDKEEALREGGDKLAIMLRDAIMSFCWPGTT